MRPALSKTSGGEEMPEQGLALKLCAPSPFVLTQLLKLKLMWARNAANKIPEGLVKTVGVGKLIVLFLFQVESLHDLGAWRSSSLKL